MADAARLGRGKPGVDLRRGQRLRAGPEQTRSDRPHRGEADDQGRADRRGPRRDAGRQTGTRARHRPSMPRRRCGADQHRPNGTLRRPAGGSACPIVRGVAQVLVVEDDPTIRTALVRGLTERGHAVASAPTGLAGLEHAVGAPPGRRRPRPRAARRRRHARCCGCCAGSARSRSWSPRPATTRPRSSPCSTPAPTTTSSSPSAPPSSTPASAPSCGAVGRARRTPRSWSAGCGSTRAPGRPASRAARWS